MSERIVIFALFIFLFVQGHALAANRLSANDNQLTQLDAQRNETLNKITARLIEGKISPVVARQLKVELDDVTKLESNAREDDNVTSTEVYNVSKCLNKVCSHLDSQTHESKIWLGIDNRDKTIHNRIADALASRKISKEQANTLEKEYEKLRSRESSGYPTDALNFNDAIAIADDLQTLNNKIDQLVAGVTSVH